MSASIFINKTSKLKDICTNISSETVRRMNSTQFLLAVTQWTTSSVLKPSKTEYINNKNSFSREKENHREVNTDDNIWTDYIRLYIFSSVCKMKTRWHVEEQSLLEQVHVLVSKAFWFLFAIRALTNHVWAGFGSHANHTTDLSSSDICRFVENTVSRPVLAARCNDDRCSVRGSLCPSCALSWYPLSEPESAETSAVSSQKINLLPKSWTSWFRVSLQNVAAQNSFSFCPRCVKAFKNFWARLPAVQSLNLKRRFPQQHANFAS